MSTTFLTFSPFSKNAPEFIDHSGHFVFMKFYAAQTFRVKLHRGVFLKKLQRVKIEVTAQDPKS